MITREQVNSLTGCDVYDRDGDKIGSVGQVWADAAGQPTWASVRTGLFGRNESLVPLQSADLGGDRLLVPFDKARVKDAPNIDAAHDEPLTQDEVDRLYRYYGMSAADSSAAYDAGAAATRDASYAGSADRSAACASTDGAMTRSEERLRVGTEREQVGRARLRKYVVTEYQQVTVPVRREEVRLERETITDSATTGGDFADSGITEAEQVVTLHAERPVIATETVPVERVRLGKHTVTEQQTVGGRVRKERIEADLPDGRHHLG
jgi:uncharacterized protein (TIGR02271 family)